LDKKGLRGCEIRNEIAGEIHEARRLNRLVENLLDMKRLESGAYSAEAGLVDLHDLIAMTGNLSKELSQHTVTIDASAELPLMRIDFALMEQVLTNLLLNASLYHCPGLRYTLLLWRGAIALLC